MTHNWYTIFYTNKRFGTTQRIRVIASCYENALRALRQAVGDDIEIEIIEIMKEGALRAW